MQKRLHVAGKFVVLLLLMGLIMACQPIQPEAATEDTAMAEQTEAETDSGDVIDSEISGTLLVDALQFPESPEWSSTDNALYFVDFMTNEVLKWSDGESSTFIETGEGTGPIGFTQAEDGTSWVAFYYGRVVQYSAEGELLQEVDNFEGAPFGGPNDLAFDSNGGLYFTDSGTFDDWATGDPNGAVYYLAADGTLSQVGDEVSYANGVVLSSDESTLIVAEHRQNRLISYTINDDGTWSDKTVFYTFDDDCQVPRDECYSVGPDGIITDSSGNYWIAHNNAGKIVVLSPEGDLLKILPTADTTSPSNLSFDDTGDVLYFSDGQNGRIYSIELASIE